VGAGLLQAVHAGVELEVVSTCETHKDTECSTGGADNMMLTTTPRINAIGCAFACVVFTVTCLSAQSKASVVGTWELDPSQSDFGPDAPPKSVTVTVLNETPQMFSWRVQGIDDKGKAFSYEWRGPEDGSLHPVMQNGKPIGQQSAKREGAIILRHGEDPDGSSFDAKNTVSADGSITTEEIRVKSKDGKETHQRFVYRRKAAGRKGA
jgi:hypothetical protein